METVCIDRLEKLVMSESHGVAQYRKWILDKLSEKFTDFGDEDQDSPKFSEPFLDCVQSFRDTLDQFLILCIHVRDLQKQTSIEPSSVENMEHSEDYVASVLDLMRFDRKPAKYFLVLFGPLVIAASLSNTLID